MGQMTRKIASATASPDGPTQGVFARRGPLRRFARITGFILILSAAIIFAGFLHFADSVTTLIPPQDTKADAIVVLTGGYQRIDQAVDLLQHGFGRRLLISGAHPSTTPAQIRRMTGSSESLFNCCVDIGYDALDTIGNANETARWIHDRGYGSVLVVTNNYHMPRSLFELRRADTVTNFIPYPVVNSDLKTTEWYADPDVLRMLLSEYGKLLFAIARQYTGFGMKSGLRTSGG